MQLGVLEYSGSSLIFTFFTELLIVVIAFVLDEVAFNDAVAVDDEEEDSAGEAIESQASLTSSISDSPYSLHKSVTPRPREAHAESKSASSESPMFSKAKSAKSSDNPPVAAVESFAAEVVVGLWLDDEVNKVDSVSLISKELARGKE